MKARHSWGRQGHHDKRVLPPLPPSTVAGTSGSTAVTQAARGDGGTRAADGAGGRTRPRHPVAAALQDDRRGSEAREPGPGPHKQSLLALSVERSSPSPSCVSELRPSCRALIAASLSAIPSELCSIVGVFSSTRYGYSSRRQVLWGHSEGGDGEKAGVRTNFAGAKTAAGPRD